MIPEIIIIVVLVGILVLLLRHWPETETVVRQQLNVRKPLEEREQAKERVGRSVWQRVVATAGAWYESVKGWLTPGPKAASTKPTKPDLTPLKSITTTKTVSKDAEPEVKPATESVETLMSRAEVAQRGGDYAEAESCLVKAAAADPKNPKVYSRLGIVYLEQGENWNEAEEAFLQALRYDPNNGYVHNNLGLVLYNQDKYAAATREFEAAVTADDKIASRHVNLGLAYMSLRQFTKAESAFKRATKFEPNNTEYRDLLDEAAAKKRTHHS